MIKVFYIKSIYLFCYLINNQENLVKFNILKTMTTLIQRRNQKTANPLQWLRQSIANLEIKQEPTARRIVKLIPAQCPFAREIRVFGKVILRIPPLCKFNPLYEQLIALRFRALCFLADQCGEDITPYCM